MSVVPVDGNLFSENDCTNKQYFGLSIITIIYKLDGKITADKFEVILKLHLE